MADAISIQELIDARTDAKTLEEAVNGDAVTTVLSRLGESYPTLANALSQIDGKLDSADSQIKQAITDLFQNGGLPATPFKTKALMTASALANDKYAMVTDDAANNGLYVKTAGVWVKSAYDVAELSKGYIKDVAYLKNRAVTHTSDTIGWRVGAYTETGFDASAEGKATNLIPIIAGADVIVDSLPAKHLRVNIYSSEQKFIRSVNVSGLGTSKVISSSTLLGGSFFGQNISDESADLPTSNSYYSYTQIVDDINNAITVREVNKNNTDLIPGVISTAGVNTESGGFHIRFKMYEFESVSLLNTKPQKLPVIYSQLGDGAIKTAYHPNSLPDSKNYSPEVYYYINVAPASVTDASEVDFIIPIYREVDSVRFNDRPDYAVTKSIVFGVNTYRSPETYERIMVNALINDKGEYDYGGAGVSTFPIAVNTSYPLSFTGSRFNGVTFLDANFNMLEPPKFVTNQGKVEPKDFANGTKYVVLQKSSLDEMTVTYNVGGEALTYQQDSVFNNSEVVVPPFIPVAVGFQMSLYKDNIRTNTITDSSQLYFYENKVPAREGVYPLRYKTRHTDRALIYRPTVAGQDFKVIAGLLDGGHNQIALPAEFQLKSVPNDNGAGRKKVLLICGDSQVDGTPDRNNPVFTSYMKQYFEDADDMNMVFVGSKTFSHTIYGETALENRVVTGTNESLGGTPITHWTGSSSPFWDTATGKIDFGKYITNMAAGANSESGLVSGDKLDYFLFPMGVNDDRLGASIPQIIERYKTMQGLVFDHSPNCKFIVGLPTLGSKYDTMTNRRKWNIVLYKELIDEFTKPEYAGKVYIAAGGMWTDNLYGSRQKRAYREPYDRIKETRLNLIKREMQGGLSEEVATAKVNDYYGLLVEERVIEYWTEYFNTQDNVHSNFISAAQQADCYYSMLRYLLEIDQN